MRLDYAPGAVLYFKFATIRPSTGAPFALSGGTISVYKDDGTTQSTTGVTLTADFDSVTGLNHITIDTSADGTFYSTGSSFQLVITAGTVDSVSVVGQVVGEFSLNRTSALRPTTAGRTLGVTAGGAATLGADAFGTSLVVGNLATASALTSVASDVTAVRTKTDNLPADPADASDIAAAFSTVNSTLATIVAYIDTEVAAIKTKTDGLPSDTAATLTTIQGYVDTLETELAKVIKSGESRTIARTGKTSVTFTETRV